MPMCMLQRRLALRLLHRDTTDGCHHPADCGGRPLQRTGWGVVLMVVLAREQRRAVPREAAPTALAVNR